ncbi:MAG: hypothetical protein ACI4AK_02955 [Lepagella sp.]
MMRFEAFSALAYGAQGIVYWQYRIHGCDSGKLDTLIPVLPSPVSQNSVSNSENGSTQNDQYTQEAPIDINGNQTPIWDMVRTVNEEILKYDYIFYNCNVIEHKLCPEGVIIDVNFGCLRRLASYGKGVLISHIKTEIENINGQKSLRKFIVIVSSDPFNSQEIELYYHLSPLNSRSKTYKILQIFPSSLVDFVSSSDDDYQANVSYAHISLEPGGFAIIEYRI